MKHPNDTILITDFEITRWDSDTYVDCLFVIAKTLSWNVMLDTKRVILGAVCFNIVQGHIDIKTN